MLETILIALFSSVTTVSLLGLIVFILRSWLLERLKASIKHEYDLKLLEINKEKEIRLKGEVVSELLSEWIKAPGKIDYAQLNRLSFQAFIWLPEKLATDLSNVLAHKTNTKDVRSILKDIRTHLQDNEDGFKAKDVVVFQEPDTYGSMSTSQVTSSAQAKPKPFK